MVETEAGAGVILNPHQRRANQILDQLLVPLDNYTGDIGVSEDAKDIWCGIANSPGIGVGPHGDPQDDRSKCFVLLAVLESREANRLERGVLEAVSLRQCDDLGSDDIPDVVQRHIEQSWWGL